MDVDVPHAGEDEAVVAEAMRRFAESVADGGDDAVLDAELAAADAARVGESAFDDRAHDVMLRKPRDERSDSLGSAAHRSQGIAALIPGLSVFRENPLATGLLDATMMGTSGEKWSEVEIRPVTDRRL
jgi:hypothetical protein